MTNFKKGEIIGPTFLSWFKLYTNYMTLLKRIVLNAIPLFVYFMLIIINMFISVNKIDYIYAIVCIIFIIPLYFSLINVAYTKDLKSLFINYIYTLIGLSILIMVYVIYCYVTKTGVYKYDDISYSLSKLVIKIEYIVTTVIFFVFGSLKL